MANNNLLASDNFGSGSLAAGWGTLFGYSKAQVIAGSPNFAEVNALSTPAGQLWTGLVWPNDQISEVTIKTLSDTSSFVGVALRFATGSFSGYWLAISGTGSNNIQITRYANGTPTVLKTITSAVAAGDVFTFMAAGSYIIAYQNYKPIGWVVDATYASGSPGFEQYTSTNLTHTQVFAWRGYGIQQQDGVWSKTAVIFPATSGDISTGGGQGPVCLTPLIYEGNAQLLSGQVYKTWLSSGLSAGASVYYAESTDGVNWTRRSSAVLAGYITPSVVKVGSTYHMYAQAVPGQGTSPFDHLTSSDGISWTVANSAVLSLGAGGAWDSSRIWSMVVVAIIAGTWYAFYSGSSATATGLANSTGLLTSTDGATWTKYGGNPVLPNCIITFTQTINGKYYAWATTSTLTNRGQGTAFGVNPAETVRYYSTDLIHWTFDCNSIHCSQMFESVNGLWGECYPFAIQQIGNKTYLYISSAISDGGTGAPGNPQYQLSIASVNTTLSQLVNFKEDAVAQVATDSFAGGAGGLGANWTTPTGYTALQVVAGPVVEASATSAGCVECFSGVSFANDQYSEVTVNAYPGTASNSLFLTVRQQTGIRTEYLVSMTQGFASLYAIVNNVLTQIGPNVAVVVNANDVWRFSAVGNVLSLFQNGFLIMQVEDVNNTITSGYPGFGMQVTATSAIKVSKWAGGNAGVMPIYAILNSLMMTGVGN